MFKEFKKGDRVATKLGRGPGTVTKVVDPHFVKVHFDGDPDKLHVRFDHSHLVEYKNKGE